MIFYSRGSAPAGNSYATSFSTTENPISEGGRWITGLATGLDWTDPAVDSNGARCTQTGNDGDNDSIAVLTGTWANTQDVSITIRTTNPQSGDVFEEIEMLLLFKISAHSARGYEINFSVNKGYSQVVRWQGAFNSFVGFGGYPGTFPNLTTGDVLRAVASFSGGHTLIDVYMNGSHMYQASDDGSFGGTPYTDGNPGLGLFAANLFVGGSVNDYSITHYSATDH